MLIFNLIFNFALIELIMIDIIKRRHFRSIKVLDLVTLK